MIKRKTSFETDKNNPHKEYKAGSLAVCLVFFVENCQQGCMGETYPCSTIYGSSERTNILISDISLSRCSFFLQKIKKIF